MRYIIHEPELEKFMILIRAAQFVCERHASGELGMARHDSAAINRLYDAASDARWFYEQLIQREPFVFETLQPIMPTLDPKRASDV